MAMLFRLTTSLLLHESNSRRLRRRGSILSHSDRLGAEHAKIGCEFTQPGFT